MQPALAVRSLLARAPRRPRIDPLAPLRRLEKCNVFLALLARTGLEGDLAEDGAEERVALSPSTLFVPDDDAFAALPARTRALLFGPSAELSIEVMEHHVARGAFRRRVFARRSHLASVQGELLAIDRANDRVRVGGAAITNADIPLDMGDAHGVAHVIAHVIDRVLSPAWAMDPSTSIETRWSKFERDRIADEARSFLEGRRGPCDAGVRRFG